MLGDAGSGKSGNGKGQPDKQPDPDEVLRRMLNTPPKPHKPKAKSRERQSRQGECSKGDKR